MRSRNAMAAFARRLTQRLTGTAAGALTALVSLLMSSTISLRLLTSSLLLFSVCKWLRYRESNPRTFAANVNAQDATTKRCRLSMPPIRTFRILVAKPVPFGPSSRLLSFPLFYQLFGESDPFPSGLWPQPFARPKGPSRAQRPYTPRSSPCKPFASDPVYLCLLFSCYSPFFSPFFYCFLFSGLAGSPTGGISGRAWDMNLRRGVLT
jgi:hypothetical protein